MSNKLENRFCDNKSLDSLYAWIDTIPLSRPKRSIARDFADGVLVAEVVAHFLPKIVELHNYTPASSWTQKRINWQTLNRRIFSKMGMRIGEDVIEQLIDAKLGVIEQVLWDIRSKVEQLCFSSDVKLNINRRSKSVTQPNASHLKRKCSLTSQLASRVEEPQLTYRVSNSILSSPSKARTACKTPSAASHLPGNQVSGSSIDYMGPAIANLACNASDHSNKPCEPKKMAPPISQFNSGFVVSASMHQTQGYVAPPTIDTSPSASGINGPVVLSPIVDKNDNINAGGPPAQIIYRGHKMIPLQFLDDKEKEMKNLETSNRSLTLKIHRLETLVNVKDQRIEDLTHQLQNLRSMYERVTETNFTGGS